MAATVMGMLGHCPEADDVGQETFISLYYSLPRFRGESTLATYITRIAMNLSLNELKRRKRRQMIITPLTAVDGATESTSKGSSIEDIDRRDLVQQALNQLKADLRAVVVVRMINGYSTAETAAILRLPVGTVLSRLARAQMKLRQILSPIIEDLL